MFLLGGPDSAHCVLQDHAASQGGVPSGGCVKCCRLRAGTHACCPMVGPVRGDGREYGGDGGGSGGPGCVKGHKTTELFDDVHYAPPLGPPLPTRCINWLMVLQPMIYATVGLYYIAWLLLLRPTGAASGVALYCNTVQPVASPYFVCNGACFTSSLMCIFCFDALCQRLLTPDTVTFSALFSNSFHG